MFSAPIVCGSFHFPFQTFGLEMRTAFWRFHSWTCSVVAPRSDALTLQGDAARNSTQRCLCVSLIQMKISFASLYALCEVSLFFLSEWSLDSSPSKSRRYVFDKARIIVDDNLNMNRDVEDCSLSYGELSVFSLRKLFLPTSPPLKKVLTAWAGTFSKTATMMLFPKESSRPEIPQIS